MGSFSAAEFSLRTDFLAGGPELISFPALLRSDWLSELLDVWLYSELLSAASASNTRLRS